MDLFNVVILYLYHIHILEAKQRESERAGGETDASDWLIQDLLADNHDKVINE